MPDLQGIVLQFDSGNLQGQTVSVASETTIGRGKDNDIVIDDPTVSGHHCKIVVEDSRFTIVDLDSTNGTNVNGSKVSKMMITSGTALQLGAVRISVK
jgi:pSer/pThr/pTyr-binding forkhead associated (FHA) protein